MGQERKSYWLGARLVCTSILSVFGIVLSLFVFFCTGVEAAPSKKEICGDYSFQIVGRRQGTYERGAMTIQLRGNSHNVTYGGMDFTGWRHKSFTYNPGTGQAVVELVSKFGTRRLDIIFSGKGNDITIKGTSGGNKHFEVMGKKTRGIPASEAGDEEDSGINWLYLGGGIFAVLVGGAALFIFSGGAGIWKSKVSPPRPTPPASPPEPEYFNYKDPAGFETLYMKDPETGQWYNYQDYREGYRVPVDMDKLQEYDAQRRQDVAWNRNQMQKLENRETGLDKELKEEHRQMLEREKQIQQETKKDLYALERGTFGMSNEERKKFLEERQAKDQKDVDKWTKRADAWDTAMTVAEGVQTAADIGVDIMATVAAPVGGGYVADAYALTKNVAGCGMEGLVNKERTLVGGLAEGLTKGLIDAGQNHSTAKWQKYLSYVGGESIKGGIDAGLKGESIVKGAVKGALQGGTKLGVDAVGKKIGDKITKNSADSLKHAYEHAGDIRNRIAPQVSERSVKALQEMNLQKHLANMHKGEHQTLANTITQGITRNLLPKIFG